MTESVVLGRGKLKTRKFALLSALLLAAGLLVQIPIVSAQESAVEEEQTAEADQPAGREIVFGESETTAMTGSRSSIWAIVQMVIVLALAAAAIYGAVFFIKRASKPAANKDPFLKCLASNHLGSNRYVHIISVGTKAWLVGACDGGINLISEVEDTDTINAMLLEDSRKTADSIQGKFPEFISMLRRLGSTASPNTPAGADEIRKRRERLKGL
ncbi:MAG: flagellar biosynthetic protein FliO [Treponema sp.]|nr:flagellar biosynthetic protein FliO [Treponema sp.]MCL2237903.1 flagellar biosynthetic protein FliO [Treponema sp.]